MNKRGRNQRFFQNAFLSENRRGQMPAIFSRKNRKGQVWVETVIYTMIAFIIIGLVLGYARPKIEELQDKAIIEQSISMLETIDNEILTLGGTGNQRIIEIGIKKGELKIDSANDKLIFEVESRYTYSEPGETIHEGNIEIKTEKQGNYNKVAMTIAYTAYNLLYKGNEEEKKLGKSALAYKLLIINKGVDDSGKTKVDTEVT